MGKGIRELLDEMSKVRKQLSEEYIFNGEEEMGPEAQDAEVVDGEQPQQEEEPQQMGVQVEPVILKMREIAIEGLKKYADDPLSPIYIFLKKVFLEADKVITDGGSK